MSRPFQPSGIAIAPTCRTSASALISARRRRRSGCGCGRSRAAPAVVDAVFLDERIADRAALGDDERERHRAADEQRVAALEQRVDDAELVAHLRAAEHRDERPVAARPSTARARRPRPRASGRPRRGITRGGPTIDACARCAAPNASSTYTSPSSLRFVANDGVHASSPVRTGGSRSSARRTDRGSPRCSTDVNPATWARARPSCRAVRRAARATGASE